MPFCPSDQSSMRPVALPKGGTEYACLRCEGLWLPGRLVHASIGATPLERIVERGTQRDLRCPNDGTALQALHHHGVEIDICPHCAGVWLDAGEREKILQQRAPGKTGRRAAEAASDISSGAEMLEAVGKAGGALLEFIGEALSGL